MKPAILLETVIRPTLRVLAQFNARMASPASEILLLGTIAQESDFCKYNTQVGGGPALGIPQVEPKTHTDLWVNFILLRPQLGRLIDTHLSLMPTLPHTKNGHTMQYLTGEEFHSQLVWNWRYAIAMARIKYWRSPDPMPSAEDLPGLARYWNDVYNGNPTKGTDAEWLASYRHFVLGELA